MAKKIMSYGRLVIPILIVIAAVAFFVLNPRRPKLPSTLNSLGYKVEVNDATFQGYRADKISASKEGWQLHITAVRGVKNEVSESIIQELDSPLKSIKKSIVITNPYSGSQTALNVPEEFKPTDKNLFINGVNLPYSIVYANEIFSLKIFSQQEVKNKGVFTVYYCPEIKTAFRTEIFKVADSFNEDGALDILRSVFCK